MFLGFSFDFYSCFIPLAYSVNSTSIERQSVKIGQCCYQVLRFAWAKAPQHPGILGVGTSWSLVCSITACCSTFEGRTLACVVVTTNSGPDPERKRSGKIGLDQVKSFPWITVGSGRIIDCCRKKAIVTVKKSRSFNYLQATFLRSKVAHPDDFLSKCR